MLDTENKRIGLALSILLGVIFVMSYMENGMYGVLATIGGMVLAIAASVLIIIWVKKASQ